MLIKLNGNPNRASEPTCGRKTLDGMLLNSLSYFGEEQICENFAPEADHSIDAPQAMPESYEFEIAAMEQSISSWQIDQQLEEISNSPFIAPFEEGVAPTSEVFRTERGTIEFVRHESGTYVRPTYNKCGMLVRVDFNGLSLYKKSNESFWQIVDQDEHEISRTEIKSVYFERNGDLVSESANGTKVVILTNGSLATR